mgnify:FL=1
MRSREYTEEFLCWHLRIKGTTPQIIVLLETRARSVDMYALQDIYKYKQNVMRWEINLKSTKTVFFLRLLAQRNEEECS